MLQRIQSEKKYLSTTKKIFCGPSLRRKLICLAVQYGVSRDWPSDKTYAFKFRLFAKSDVHSGAELHRVLISFWGEEDYPFHPSNLILKTGTELDSTTRLYLKLALKEEDFCEPTFR